MLTRILYCKDHHRRPIRLGICPCFQDVQAQIPLAWCSVCGSEIFESGQQQCIRCRVTKGAKR